LGIIDVLDTEEQQHGVRMKVKALLYDLVSAHREFPILAVNRS
jgi:hypothetical protein